jgi:hypothetical protein
MSVALEVRQDAIGDAVGAKGVAPVARTACVSSRSARFAGIVIGVICLLVSAAILLILLFSDSDAAGDDWVGVRAEAADSEDSDSVFGPRDSFFLRFGFLETLLGNSARYFHHQKDLHTAAVKTGIEEACMLIAIAFSSTIIALIEVFVDVGVHVLAEWKDQCLLAITIATGLSVVAAWPFAALFENIAGMIGLTPTIVIWGLVHVLGWAAPSIAAAGVCAS